MTFDNLNDPRQYLDAMAMIDTARTNHYPLEISKPRAQRSNQQNNFYYFCLKYYASQIGFTRTDSEREFKELCNPDIFVREVKDSLGNVHRVIRSSADLTKEETRLLDKIYKHFYTDEEFYSMSISKAQDAYMRFGLIKNKVYH